MSITNRSHEFIRITNDNMQTLDFIKSVKEYILDFYNLVGIIHLYEFELHLTLDDKKEKIIYESYSYEDSSNPEKVKESFENIDSINTLDEFTNIVIYLKYYGEFRTFHYVASDIFDKLLNNELAEKIAYRSYEIHDDLARMYIFEEHEGKLRKGFIVSQANLELIQYGDNWYLEQLYFEASFTRMLTLEDNVKLKEMTHNFCSYFPNGLDLEISSEYCIIHAYDVSNSFSLYEINKLYEIILVIYRLTSQYTSEKTQLTISFTQADYDWIQLDISYGNDGELYLFVLSIDGLTEEEYRSGIDSTESVTLPDEDDGIDIFAESSEEELNIESELIAIPDFANMSFVLTECRLEKSIANFILNRKGAIKASISKKVDYLIYGSVETKKYEEAFELINNGSDIELINETNFLKEFHIKPYKSDSEIIGLNIFNVSSAIVELNVMQGKLDSIIPKVHLEYYMGRENRHSIDLILQELKDKGVIQLSKGIIKIEHFDKLNEYALMNLVLSYTDEY